MSDKKEDNRTYEEIKADWNKNGLAFGRLMSDDEMQNAKKQISEYTNNITAKERKKANRHLHTKPTFLVSCADILQRAFHIIVTLYSMAILINALFIWQIYKTVSAAGWQGIFQTKYTLYILLYFVLLFVLKKLYYTLYKYAHD